ncbi:MAG: NPCBM/NEW2 domain-containing protein [Verrucomicrobia bacterium]|nr:NPCBM/NEW2 domain-containing protein [Verrucomicrobiota bacterium]
MRQTLPNVLVRETCNPRDRRCDARPPAIGQDPASAATSPPALIHFTWQTRDADTGTIRLTTETVDPRRVGVIAVDVWNFHWCKTATMRVDAIVPRINQALDAARALGMTVMLCPSDVVDNYAGYPQRERVLALPLLPVPAVVDVTCPPAPDPGGCACDSTRCAVNYGWDGMHPGLRIAPEDWMPDTQAEVYALCRKFGLTHLIYVGFHTQVCLLGKPMGLRAMKSAGPKCMLARDLTDAHPGYDPAQKFTPDLNTEQVVAHFEKYLAPTIHFEQELTRLGRWNPPAPVDAVRIAPWGTLMRPHLFEQPVIVTLATPHQPGAEIRYTLDGSPPTTQSAPYAQPLVITETTHLRTTAFRDGQSVSRESEAFYARLAPMPPAPDVHLSDLEPVRSVGFGHSYGGQVRYAGNTQPPQKDRANPGGPLRTNRQTYQRGLGVHAPCALMYALQPDYQRFVALAGVDEHLVGISHGSNLAQYPSVVFKVFIDGTEAAASPVMRLQSPAWRFDLELPRGAQRINLVAMDAGDGSREDFANWVDAGFVLRR